MCFNLIQILKTCSLWVNLHLHYVVKRTYKEFILTVYYVSFAHGENMLTTIQNMLIIKSH